MRRLAGDEFVVILEGLHGREQSKIGEAVGRPIDTSVGPLIAGTSFGIAVHPGNELTG